MDNDKLVTIQAGNQCSCYQQMAFDHQCCHEMHSEGGFNIPPAESHLLAERDHLPACSNKDVPLKDQISTKNLILTVTKRLGRLE
jgi:hypothetical protein